MRYFCTLHPFFFAHSYLFIFKLASDPFSRLRTQWPDLQVSCNVTLKICSEYTASLGKWNSVRRTSNDKLQYGI
ncbi:hypothetical protein M378DRAFT_726568 [Amanita muscaria Koide BX008]|uniref:Uncharacterized protein n=1 Tax=Amanita muscaria (strain Koide BX008) TaxID=946122 RepID=A0A0C2X3H3_AMAMK|nr:hypothetical protein M378DRAFT_726568 [Amanita muscaria Koide BX008]